MKTVESEIAAILSGSISAITQRSIFRRLGGIASLPVQQLSPRDRQAVQAEIESSIRLFAPARSGELISSCARVLGDEPSGRDAAAAPPGPELDRARKLPIEGERDIAAARLEAWSEAVRLGLSKFASVKVATAVSELARNIVFYAGKGSIDLRTVRDGKGTRLEIVATDEGPGIDPAKVEAIFAGSFKSERGLGKGLVAVQKLVDDFHLDTRPGRGTRVSCVFKHERSGQ
jgi:serine/threonine-protein kinase RsbT